MISQQLITYTMWCMQCYLNIKQIAIHYLKNEEQYGKTIYDRVPLSFQEFFQIRQT